MPGLPRLRYRVRQFWRALFPPRQAIDEALLQEYLAPAQLDLFRRMHPSEQVHALAVFRRLYAGGARDPDLLTAALLHDVGKSLAPLALWERVLIVLAKRLFPRRWSAWGEGGAPRGWRRPFVVARQHPAWGADLAAAAGTSPRACDLIRRHQEDHTTDDLLRLLQQADEAE